MAPTSDARSIEINPLMVLTHYSTRSVEINPLMVLTRYSLSNSDCLGLPYCILPLTVITSFDDLVTTSSDYLEVTDVNDHRPAVYSP